MLSQPLYEAKPYALVIAGSGTLITQDTLLAWGAGLILYVAGTAIWLLRSDSRGRPATPRKTHRLPHRLYEVVPFLYLLAGSLSSLTYNHFDGHQLPPLTLAAAVMFCGAGLGSWLMRLYHRGFHRAFLAPGPTPWANGN